MDRLDDLLHTAGPLLDRVDELLGTAGAPAGHPVWEELRRVRLRPGDAARAVAALRPTALGDAGPHLRSAAQTCVEAAADLPAPGEWAGEAAEAYDGTRRRIAARLTGDPESLDQRLAATADLAEALRSWLTQTRAELVAALATVLTSSEALILTTGAGVAGPLAEVEAAADVAAHLLRTVAERYADAVDLMRESAALRVAAPMEDATQRCGVTSDGLCPRM